MRLFALSAMLLTAVAAALASCSTVATRRDDPPTLVRVTPKTIAQFRSCFLPQFDKSAFPVVYAPTEHGETYSWGPSANLGRYVNWVIDITDEGASRKVVLHAITSMWGVNHKLVGQVEACL
jgi:hypothetical protein